MKAMRLGSGVTAAFVAAVILLAGCFQASTPSEGDGAGSAAIDVPSECDGNRTAVSYTSAGPAVAADGRGCLYTTGLGTYEPTLGIHPETGQIVVYPVYGNVALGPLSMARSDDGGATWHTVEIAEMGVPTHPYSLDPFLWLDPATGRAFVDDLLTVHCSAISFTDDAGDTWTHSATPCTQADHINIFAGPPAVSPTVGYPNVVYRCGINTVAVLYASFSSTCQKSLDGGMTWVNTGSPAFVTDPTAPGIQGVPGWCDGGVGHGAVGPDGTVYLGKGLCGTPMVASSQDEGLTWERVTISDLGMMVMFCNNYDHEVNVATDPSGNVYAFWVDNQHVPRLTVSQDQGQTWSDAVDVAPPGVTQASMPQLAVGADGRVAMLYMGSTNAPEGPFPTTTQTDPANCEAGGGGGDPAYADVTWNAYITVSVDVLAESPTFTTVTANDPADPLAVGKCGFRCPGFGDFLDIQIGPDGTPWAALVDPDGEVGDSTTPGGEAVVGRMLGGLDLTAADA